ncbi:MAG: prepilin-type N-terminal cleavage/methylation domain-containing protein [Bacteroidota bacterium]
MNRYGLDGFTLLELLVVIALTSLVLLLGQYIYIAFYHFHTQYETSVSYTYELSQIQYSIDRDILQATAFQWEEENELCLMNGEDLISCYLLHAEGIRKSWGVYAMNWELSGNWQVDTTSTTLLFTDSLRNIHLRFNLPAKGTAKKGTAKRDNL